MTSALAETLHIRFNLTNCERAVSELHGQPDEWCRTIARCALEHGTQRQTALQDGMRLGPPRFVDQTPPDYDGWKGAWYSEILSG